MGFATGRKLLTSFLLCFALRFRNIAGQADDLEGRIVGGSNASAGDFPFFVQWSGCGASLIHPDILLTAGHCKDVASNTVIVGAYTRWTVEGDPVNSVVRQIVAREVHPLYDRSSVRNDFMLMKINETVSLLPALVNSDEGLPVDGQNLTILGFGSVEPRLEVRLGSDSDNFTVFNPFENATEDIDIDLRLVEILQEATVPQVNFATCKARYGGFPDEETMLCAGLAEGGVDACIGDSGGPLLMMTENGYSQVGVISFGSGCARPQTPGVYSKVSSAAAWIQAQICLMSSVKPADCPATPAPTPAPSRMPTLQPTFQPSLMPSTRPTEGPTEFPTTQPTVSPTSPPTTSPTTSTTAPTGSPTKGPTQSPTLNPSRSPTSGPTTAPTGNPTNGPTGNPTVVTLEPTISPTIGPSGSPTLAPTRSPTSGPTGSPSSEPSGSPTSRPTESPTIEPTVSPTIGTPTPTGSPTFATTASSTGEPTRSPTMGPTESPTNGRTGSPTNELTESPTRQPTTISTLGPTVSPTTILTSLPTFIPTQAPVTVTTTQNPMGAPSAMPTSGITAGPTEFDAEAIVDDIVDKGVAELELIIDQIIDDLIREDEAKMAGDGTLEPATEEEQVRGDKFGGARN